MNITLKKANWLKVILSKILVCGYVVGFLIPPTAQAISNEPSKAKGESATRVIQTMSLKITSWLNEFIQLERHLREVNLSFLTSEALDSIPELSFAEIHTKITAQASLNNINTDELNKKLKNAEDELQSLFEKIKSDSNFNDLVKQSIVLKQVLERNTISQVALAGAKKIISPLFHKIHILINQLKTIKRIRMAYQFHGTKILNRGYLSKGPLGYHYSILDSGASGDILERKSLDNTRTGTDEPFSYKVKFTFSKDYSEVLWVDIDPKLKSKDFYIVLLNAVGDQNGIGKLTVKNGETGTAYSHFANNLPDATLEHSTAILDDEAIEVSSTFKPAVERKVANASIPELFKTSLIRLKVPSQFTSECYNFIDKNGNYGVWGEAIAKSFFDDNGDITEKAQWLIGEESNRVSDTVGGIVLNKHFRDYSLAQKVDFMIYYAAVIAQKESSCRQAATVSAVNGTAVGLWQLHLGKTDQYANKACEKKFKETDGAANVVCGLKMLNNYTQMNKNENHEYFWKSNYWQTMHIKSTGKESYRLIKKYESTPMQN